MTDLAILIYHRTTRFPDRKEKHEVLIGGLALEALSQMHAHTLVHQLKNSIDTHTTCGATVIPVIEIGEKSTK
jgi:hypothetical protein